MFRVIIRNAVSNWVGYLVQAALALLLTPFVLGTLGTAQYGVWALIIGLTGYYGLLDLGIRAGLTQYMTRHLANRDFAQLNRTASTGVVALAGCGGFILFTSLGLATAAPLLFHLPLGSEHEVGWALAINGCAIAFQFPLFPFSAVFAATQRYDLANLIGITTRVVTALATFYALSAGHGLIGLSVVVAGGNLLDYALRWLVAYSILPELRVSPSLANLKSCWEFVHFGLWNVVIGGSNRLLLYSGAILIGLLMPAAAIAPYAVAASLINYFTELFVPLGTVFFPMATELDAQNQVEGLRSLYLFGAKMLVLLAAPLALLAGFWAEDFFRLWLGTAADSDMPGVCANLFHLLLIGAVVNSSQRVSYQILLATRRLKLLAVLFGCEAVVATTLALCLIPWLGLYGAAVGSVLPALVFQGIVHPAVVNRLVQVPWRCYLATVWLRPLLGAALLTVVLMIIRLAHPVSTWSHLLIQGAAGGAAALTVMALVGLSREQRRRLLFGPLERWLRRPIPDKRNEPRLQNQPTALSAVKVS